MIWSRKKVLLAGAATWAGYSTLSALALSFQEQIPFLYALLSTGFQYALLALLAVPLARSIARIHRPGRRVPIMIVLHGIAALSVLILWLGSYYLAAYVLLGPEPVRDQFEEGGLWLLHSALTTYALLVAGIVLIEQQRRASELRIFAREAELRALRAQLRPHFIFNVLNSVYAMIAIDPQGAQKMVELVAGLIRTSLDSSDETLVPFENELAIAARYLEIEKLRFGDRLSVSTAIEEGAAAHLVPPLILQPIVENAIKHGIAKEPNAGSIAIHARLAGRDLAVSIENTGPLGRSATSAASAAEGIGLALTRSRLATMYGARFRFQLRDRDAGGAIVELLLPSLEPDQ